MKFLLSILFVLLLSSCLLTGHAPTARYCYLDTKTHVVHYTRKDEGIHHIKVIAVGEAGQSGTLLYDADFRTAADSIDLSSLDTAKLNSSKLIITLWERSPVIEDYDMELKAGEWMSGKVYYFMISVR